MNLYEESPAAQQAKILKRVRMTINCDIDLLKNAVESLPEMFVHKKELDKHTTILKGLDKRRKIDV